MPAHLLSMLSNGSFKTGSGFPASQGHRLQNALTLFPGSRHGPRSLSPLRRVFRNRTRLPVCQLPHQTKAYHSVGQPPKQRISRCPLHQAPGPAPKQAKLGYSVAPQNGGGVKKALGHKQGCVRVREVAAVEEKPQQRVPALVD